jgi:hypothetical protein
LTYAPNPVVICEKTGRGAVTLSWTAGGPNLVYTEVHLDAPDGSLFTKDSLSGSAKTGDWVAKGTVFFLQDATDGVPRDLDHTLARLEVDNVTAGKCK